MSFFMSDNTGVGSSNAITENFEDGDISEYSLDTGSFSIQNNTVKNGTYALKAEFAGEDSKRIVSSDFSVGSGTTYRCNMQITNNFSVSAVWGTQDENTLDGYAINFYHPTHELRLRKFTDDSATNLATTDHEISYNSWYEVELDWGSNGSLTATFFNGGSQVAQISGNDTTYKSGGIGWRMRNPRTNTYAGYFDHMRDV